MELLNCDWVSILLASARNISRPTFTFAVPMNAMGGQELLDLLDTTKIERWGELIINENWVVSVPKGDEGKVVRLLSKRGINLE